MLIAIIKFIHLLLTLSILGATVYCLTLITSRKFALANTHHSAKIKLTNRILMWLVLFAIITGTLLVYPKNFTFHTPWIQMAYVLILIFSFGIGLLMLLQKKSVKQQRWLWFLSYGLLLSVLITLVHDAVTKTLFF